MPYALLRSMADTDPSASPRDAGLGKKGVVDVWTLVFVAIFIGAMVYQIVTGC